VGSVPSMFATHGLSADRIAPLGWVLTLISIMVTLIVTALLLIALARRRAVTTSDVASDGHAAAINRWIVIGGVIVPALVIAGSFVYTLQVQGAVSDPPGPPAMTVQVIGHRWWWEVRYDGPAPDERVTTANEIHLPVGRPIRVELTTQDVIHSFWVPQLAGKTDVINGQTNVTWLEARTPGTYRGECAEYCGVQHANMALSVVAEDSAGFAAWLAHQGTSAAVPQDTAARTGARVFLAGGCPACHTVRGTWTLGVEGPDLTHVATRLTLGAGLLDNNEGNLAGWVSNAPALKPGIVMPATHLNSAELRALVAYLETLR
jgi:cytochrome c oxidase subunit II